MLEVNRVIVKKTRVQAIKKRLKMGRKGIGKLAALSISNGFQLVTIRDGVVSGVFIPNKIETDNEILRNLSPSDYKLKYILQNGLQ